MNKGVAAAALLVLGLAPQAASAGDLSKYRSFRLGADLAAVAKQTGVSAADAKTIHSRPALIQELEWQPQPAGLAPQAESVQAVTFGFYSGELYRIVVNYDRYEMEGLTEADIVGALSAAYGIGSKPAAAAKSEQDRFGDREDVLARWEDGQYRFDLMRVSYGPAYKLVCVLKRLEAPALAAIVEAERLDRQEAPERDAARFAADQETERANLEKARLVNKARFRP